MDKQIGYMTLVGMYKMCDLVHPMQLLVHVSTVIMYGFGLGFGFVIRSRWDIKLPSFFLKQVAYGCPWWD